jgi:circadian clock protein KaiB
MSAAPKRATYRFRLYVTGGAQNSLLAIANLAEICQMHLADRSETEIVDVFRTPERALEDHVFMTPTLVTLAPRAIPRIVGTLSDRDPVLRALRLEVIAA